MRRYGKQLIKKISKAFPGLELNTYHWDKQSDYAIWCKGTIICIILCFKNNFKIDSSDIHLEWKPIKYSQWYLVCQLIHEILNKQ